MILDIKTSEAEPFTIPFGRNRYCGPAALAYVTRTDTDRAAALLREVSGKRKITGTEHNWMLKALSRVGLGVEPTMPVRTFGKRLTLRKWLDFAAPSPDQQFIVTVTGHYIVVHGSQWFDSRCHLGKPLTRCPYLNKTVVRAWKITGVPQVPELSALTPGIQRAQRKRAIEKRFNVKIAVDQDGCEVFPVRNHHSFDDGLHSLLCNDLDDVEERVSLPVRCPEDCDCRS